AALRSKNLTIRGAGPGAWGFDELNDELPEMLSFVAETEPPKLRVEKLSDIEKVWGEKVQDGERLVFTV
ncbi:hypothetical protein K466DRAFT_606105, partial [Polyporus arcularius HHB13444]